MVSALQDILLGDRYERNLDLLAAAVVFVGTFFAYATGTFAVDGGLVFLPVDATVVGLVVAAGIGYRQSALLGAWVTLFVAYFAFYAEWAFLSLPGRPLTDRLAFLFEPTSLGLAAVASVVLGTIAFAVGHFFRTAIEYVRESQ